MAKRIEDGEGCLQRSVSFKPSKIIYSLSKGMKDYILIDNLGMEVSILVVYFIKNIKNKKFIQDLKKIKTDISHGNVEIPKDLLG